MAHHLDQKLISTLVLLMTITKIPNSLSQCVIKSSFQGRQAVCRRKNLTEIPQTIDPTVEALDVSENFLKSIKREDLKRYKNIWQFIYLQYIAVPPDKVTTFYRDAFLELVKVKHLELNGNPLTDVKIDYPLSVTDLFLEGTQLTDATADFSYLENLEMVYFKKNNLTKWPGLHKFAPIDSVDLADNPIEYFTAKKIARYCNLTYVGIKLRELKSFVEDRCECARMQEWIKMSSSWVPSVVGKIQVEGTDFHCAHQPYCETEPLITDRMKLLHDNCMKGIRDKSLDDGDVEPGVNGKKYILWLFAIIILGVTAFIIYIFYKKRQEFEVRATPSTVIESELPDEDVQQSDEEEQE